MASLYPKPGTAFWYLRYRDPKTGRTVDRSTKLRRDDPEQTRQAKRLRAEWEAKELAAPTVKTGEAWEAWVPAYLRIAYARSELTRIRAVAAWHALATFFREKGILSARVLTRAHCLEYAGWRVSDDAFTAGLRKVSHNTALLELKFLSKIMREAVTRGLAIANPALQLGLSRTKTRVKPEITDEEVAKIEAALLSPEEMQRPENEAMRIAWKVALLQVCRLKETCVPLVDVNLEEQTITFRVKGGRDHSAMLHPELVPLFRKLKAGGRRLAYEMPRNFAKCWFYFFRRHGLGHLSFHSTRVTGVTRLRRQGVDLRIAMEFVGHSSVLVHRIYQRQRKDDQLAAIRALSRESKPSSESPDSPPAT